MTTNAQTNEQTEPDATYLDSRYGRTAGRTSKQRVLGWTVAIAFVLVFTAWVAWVSLDGTGTTIDTRDLGHQVIDDSSVRISYEISMSPGLEARCALQVQNESHAIVGWKIVDVPASETFTRSFTDVVRSSELGVTGLIYQCWLV